MPGKLTKSSISTKDILENAISDAVLKKRIGEGCFLKISALANETGQYIILFGSRAKGTAGIQSDWDYMMSGNYRARHRILKKLPGYTARDNAFFTTTTGHNIDLWQLRSQGNKGCGLGYLVKVINDEDDYYVFAPKEVKYPLPDRNISQLICAQLGLFSDDTKRSKSEAKRIESTLDSYFI